MVQLFRRLPALLASAPTQQEAPLVVTRLLVLGLCVAPGRAVLTAAGTGPRPVPEAAAPA